MEKKGTPASPATALASSVLPVPGGPTSSTPLGMLAPMELYLDGLCRKSTISFSASLASSSPATSENVLPVWLATYILAPDLPMPNIMELPPIFLFIDRISRIMGSSKSRVGNTQVSRKFIKKLFSCGTAAAYFTPLSSRRWRRSGSGKAPVV